MNRFVSLLIVVLLAAVPLAAATPASPSFEPKFRPGAGPGAIANDYIVVLNDVPRERIETIVRDLARKYEITPKEVWTRALKGFWVSMPEFTARMLSNDTRVRYVEQNVRMVDTSGSQRTDRTGVVAETSFDYPAVLGDHPLWHLWRLNHRSRDEQPPTSYTYAPGSDGSGVRIYVVDTGVLRFHREFADDAGTTMSDADKKDPLQHKLQVKELAGSNVTDKRTWASSAPHKDCSGTALTLPVENSTAVVNYWASIWESNFDNHAHGTAVGSVAAGRNVGVAKKATLVPVKTDECGTDSSTAYFIRAFDWILEEAGRGARVPGVVTMSTYRTLARCEPWEGALCKADEDNEKLADTRSYVTSFEEAVQAVIGDGIPVVASANNNGRDACSGIPARLSRNGGRGGVITVGGLSKQGDYRFVTPTSAGATIPSDSSNWGPCVDLWAPAEEIAVASMAGWSRYFDEDFTGTSYSAPMVAGLIARMFSEDAGLRADFTSQVNRTGLVEKIWKRLRDAATPLPLEAITADAAADVSHRDTALKALAQTNATTGALVHATSRRMAYMGAFGFSEQPASVVLNGTAQSLRAEPAIVGTNRKTEWYASDSTTPVKTFFPTDTDHSLCIRAGGANGCLSPGANTGYWARVTLTVTPPPPGAAEVVSADSATATVVVLDPIITVQPKSVWVSPGADVTFEVTALFPPGATASYQWYRGSPGLPTETLITGAESDQYTVDPPPAAGTATGYFVKINDDTISDVAFLRVDAACPQLSPPGPATILPALGVTPPTGKVVITLPDPGTPYEYRWFVAPKGPNAERLKLGRDGILYPVFGRSISLDPGEASQIFARVYAGQDCLPVESDVIDVTPACTTTLEVSPSTGLLPDGGSRVLSVRASNGGGNYTYQWYRLRTVGSEEIDPIPGFVTSEIDVTTPGTYYVRVDNGTCARLSPPMTVSPIPQPTSCAPRIDLDGPIVLNLIAGQNIVVPFTEPMEVHAASHYLWLLDGADFNRSESFTCKEDNAPCTVATRTATQSEKIRLRLTGQCFIGLSQESSEDSPLITVNVCQNANFTITSVPTRPTTLHPFKLYAPLVTGGTYVWRANGDVIPNVSGPVLDVSAGINIATTYTVTVSDPVCSSSGVASAPLTITPCGNPRRRAVRKTSQATAEPVIVPAGTIVPLSVDDDHDGVSFEWFRSATASYTGAVSVGGNTATINVTAEEGTVYYWVRLTTTCNGTPQTTDTDFLTVTGECNPSIVVPPAPASATMPGEHDPPVHVTASVVASGIGLTYEWHKVGDSDVISTDSSYTFVYAYTDDGAVESHEDVYVVIHSSCGGRTESTPVTLSVRRNTQRIFAFGGGGEKYPLGSSTLSVNMDPNAGPGHVYHYVWYRDNGTPEGEALPTDNDELGVPPWRNTYWVKVTGTHTAADDSTYTEVSVSGRIHVWPRGTCELPPVTVQQSATDTTNSNAPVVLTAMCDWDNVTFQWYEGQSGDTRVPRNSDYLKNERLTVAADPPAAFWVRASLECGAYQDSETVTFTRGECAPLLINQNVASVEVAYGEDTALHFDPVPNATYDWYHGESGVTLSQEHQPTLERPNVQSSGRYRVRATLQKAGCPDMTAESFVATVRVASCPSITPPVWQTEVWTTTGVAATLDATASQGASGYQWYRGEVGDTSNLLTGETLPTFNTGPLTADAKYWVRIIGSSCIVDSPTITVRVCVPPALSGGQSLQRNIERNQVITWDITAVGTDLSYQWYVGASGDESHPVGPNLDRYRVTPEETTQYWVKVTGRCGTPLNSATYTATVCPQPQAPTASASLVMPGATPTISISSTGTALTYQWYIGSWDDISHPIAGATTATITPTVTATTSYWCQVTSGTCSRNSAPVTVNVCPTRQLTWNYNAKTKVEKDDSQIISVNITGDDPVDETTFYLDGVVGDVTQGTPIHLVTNAYQVHSSATQTYWARARSANGCYTDSALLTIEVCIPTITAQPQAVMLDKTNPAATTTLTVVADIAPVTYQWYVGASGDMTSPIAGATAATLTVSPSADTTYWVRVLGSCGIAKISDAATVTVCTPPAVTTGNAPAQIQSGAPTFVSVTATGTGLTYQWYRGTPGDTASPVSNGTAATLQVSPSTTTSYWCRVTSRGTCWADSNAITVDVCTPPAITAQPQSPPRSFTGTQVMLSVTATPATGLTYQWYTGAAGDLGAPISGATSSTLTVAPTAETSYWVQVKNGVCATNSTAATVSLCTYAPTVNLPATRNIAYGESTTLPFPNIYPLNEPKHITWYRGQSGDRSTPVHYTMSASTLDYTTPVLTANTPYWMDFEHGGCVTTSTATTVTVCKPTITASPVGTTITSGTPTMLSVSTTPVAGQTFQWYIGTSGTTTNPVAGATSASLTVSPTSTTSYWVRVKGTCVPDATVDSAAATVTVCVPPAITSISPTRYIAAGNTTTVTVTATGSNLTYQWYVGASGVTTNPVSGGTSNTLAVSPGSTTNYWCRVKSEGVCTANSAAVIVDVCTNPTITTQPAPQRVFAGTPVTLSVVASASGAMTYQWYTGASGVISNPIAGATSASLTVSPAVETSYWVRIKVGTQCSVDSVAATVSMCDYSPTVTLPATRNIASGESVTLTFPTMYPLDGAKDITWYRGAAGDRSNPVRTASATSVNYTTPATTVNTPYWFEFVHDGCVTVSTVTTVTVCKPTITGQPQSATILSGASRTLTVTATGSPLTYQWYIGNSGDVSQPVAGATSASLTVTPAATTTYWVRATGCSTTADSTAATVTVCTAPVITNLTRTTNYTINSTGSLTVTATGTNLTYQWYKGQSGVTTSPIAGATSATYSFTLHVSDYYWVRVTSGCNGASVDSAALLYSVAANITAQPASITIPRNTSTTLSVTATGTYLSYQWYKGAGTSIAGATSSTYTTPVLTTGVNEYWCEVKSGTIGQNSLHASVSLCDGPTIVSFTQTYNYGTTYRLTVMVHSSQYGIVEYHWYRGVPGDLTQSTYLGQSDYVNQQYFTVTTPTTYWVRVRFTDGSCYTDTVGKTLP